jgi:hypothetical protein
MRGLDEIHQPASAGVLTAEAIAGAYAILPETVEQLRRKHILPSPDAGPNEWHAATVEQIIESLHQVGLPPNKLLPYTHTVVRKREVGPSRQHVGWRHRGQRKTIRHPPQSIQFVRKWFQFERGLAAQQAGNQSPAPSVEQATSAAPGMAVQNRGTASNSAETHQQNQRAAERQPKRQSPLLAPRLVTQIPASEILTDSPRSPAELVSRMRRRRASITQAEIARVIRAAKQAGAAEVELRLNDSQSAIIRLQPDDVLNSDDENGEIVL